MAGEDERDRRDPATRADGLPDRPRRPRGRVVAVVALAALLGPASFFVGYAVLVPVAVAWLGIAFVVTTVGSGGAWGDRRRTRLVGAGVVVLCLCSAVAGFVIAFLALVVACGGGGCD